MMASWLKRLAKTLIALPYRIRFATLGRSVKIVPPLLLEGAGRAHVGNGVILEKFVGIAVSPGGEVRIGDDCEIRCFARLEAHDGYIRLGARCGVNPFTLLSGYGGLTIGSDVRIGSHCAILSSGHEFESTDMSIREQGIQRRPTVIEDNVWMGHGCTVIGGVRIGSGAVIGAGAVVTRDVPADSVAAGIPAKVTRTRGA